MRLPWSLKASGTKKHRALRASNHLARPAGSRRLRVESLESRRLLSATLPGVAVPTYIIHHAVAPFASGGATGYSPAQVRAAYGFNNIALNGAGTTIAIVDAYDDPNVASDLKQFDAQFGLPNPTFTKENQNGSTSSLPAPNQGWSDEISLDVEWAHAIAPGAKILLVEANSASMNDLMAAVNTARNATGVVAVSMSWGGGEFSGEQAYDGYFTTPAGHNGVTFVASAGDSGAPAIYPAASPNVVSAGGTSLYLSGSGGYGSESAWSGSGGGVSSVEAQPSYQKGIVSQSSTGRATPDVSYDADPNTGVPVYDSYDGGWAQYGGTSAAAPQWAALVAIADQGRAANGLGSLDGPSQTLPLLYSMPAADFHDVTSGSSTGSPQLFAGPGYDLVTGRGTPVANLVIQALVGGAIAPSAAQFSVTTSAGSDTAGQSFTVTVTALTSTGSVFTGFTGTVQLSSSDGQAILPLDHTFTAADKGVYVFTGVTLLTAGSDTITAAETSNGAVTGSVSKAVLPAAANRLAFVQQPAAAVAGTVINPAVTVEVLDAYGNLVTGDSTDKVSIALAANSSGATLNGTTTATVSGGMASFGNLAINNVGNGCQLQAASGTLASAASAAFNVTAVQPSSTIEGFESGSLSNYWYVGRSRPTVSIVTAAAHDGNYGLATSPNNDWYFRNDAAAQVQQGDTISVWMQFSSTASGRAYFGFGAGPNGTLSLVAAPNTGQLILQDNTGYGYVQLAAVNQAWQANHWYHLEVDWGASGAIVGKLYDSNGSTLLSTVSAADTSIAAGGFAFRTTGSTVYWDTVALSQGVNAFAVRAAATGASGHPSAASSSTAANPCSAAAIAAIATGGGTSGVSNQIRDQLFSEAQFLESLGWSLPW